MLRECVSLGNLRSKFGFDSSTTDLYGPTTSDKKAYSNISFLEDTNTPWVRLFVCWNFWWPNPPRPPKDPRTMSYPIPRPCPHDNRKPPPPCRTNAAQMVAQMFDLIVNLYEAKYPGSYEGPEGDPDHDQVPKIGQRHRPEEHHGGHV